jgi:hypothetical protein
MKNIIAIVSILMLSSCAKIDSKKEINDVLDSLHYLASVADQKKYIDLFSEDAVFFGTDISERWSKIVM